MPDMDLSFYKEISSHETVIIKRSQIRNAPYNPRKITKRERENLYKLLDSHKLVEDLVWNKLTGNLVSGHQRLTWIDLKARERELKDFDIRISQIDVDEKEEMEINLGMNNDAAMGKFDLDLMGDMLEKIDYGLAGFDDKAIEELIGADFDVDRLSDEDVEKRVESYNEGIAHRKRMQAASFRENNIEYYTNIVFPDKIRREEFFALLGIKDEMIIDGNKVINLIRERFQKRAIGNKE
jgi:hypothetical protein